MEIKEDGKESRVERTFCIIYFDRRGGRRRGGQRQKRRSIKFVDHLPSLHIYIRASSIVWMSVFFLENFG